MSQHIVEVAMNGNPVSVTLGYDRQINYVFCTVTTDQDEVLYSDLDDDKARLVQQDIAYYRPVLARLGLVVPETMYAAVREDQLARRGNRLVLYGSDGQAKEQRRASCGVYAPYV